VKGDYLISYYGDDFTGSTDVLEALSSNGVETVLFTSIPDQASLDRFAGCRAVGLAGTSRSQPPEWMDRELPAVLAWLRSLGTPVVHYKVCSTFDSAPHRGSIGRAIEIGLDQFGQDIAPVVVGAPELGRYIVFGQLFATFHGEVFRIDRHPVMSRHPVTPMAEADLLLHLGRQTDLPIGRIDLADLLADREGAAFAALRANGARAALLDVYDDRSQRQVGLLLSAVLSTQRPLVFGSSGVEYALLGTWKSQGLIGERPAIEPLEKVDRMIVVSGSCSAVTETQIRTAVGHGFTGIALDYDAIASGQGADVAFAHATEQGRKALSEGGSPILYTALGAADASPEAESGEAGDVGRVGRALGRLIALLASEFDVERLVVAGGDTSSHALRELDIDALTLRHPIPQSPGSPVCLGHRRSDRQAAVEIALKGGQIGKPDYFARLREGDL
jgi:uncharacterized protein YgbK (DUF1537 family)